MSFTSWLQNIRAVLAPNRGGRNDRRRSLRGAKHRPRLELLEDRCTPSFGPAVNYPAGTDPVAVLTADFNGDTRPDLAVANPNSDTVSVLLGNADGTFQPAETSSTGLNPSYLAVGDFNGDGRLDLASVASWGDVSVLRGNGNGTFQAPTDTSLDSSPTSVAVGDFNADGKLDLGVSSIAFVPGSPGYWVSDPYYGDIYYPPTPDSSEGRASVLLGHGDGSFGPLYNTVLGTDVLPNSAALADFNGDGKLDFATDIYSSGSVSVLLGTGTGGLGWPTAFSVGASPVGVVAGDFNGDGKPDLATSINSGADVSVLLGTGTGAFVAVQNYALGSSAGRVVTVGDFNRDGRGDLVTANAGAGTVGVLLGTGTGSFQLAGNHAVGTEANSAAVSDFNGDLFPDLAATNADSGTVSVRINDQSWPPLPGTSVSVTDATVTEGNTGTVGATFTVTLSGPSDQTVTVDFATAAGTAGGSDFVPIFGTLTFLPGEVSRPMTVQVQGDLIDEDAESFTVNLSSPTNAFLNAGRGTGTIVDDDPVPTLVVSDVQVTEGNSGTTAAVFTVSLSAPSSRWVLVHYVLDGGTATANSDYLHQYGGVLFSPGQALSQTVTVRVNGDTLDEANETFFFNLSFPTNAVIADGQGVATIVDDDPPGLRISEASVTEGNSGTRNATFTVTLSRASDQAVTVSYATADGTASAGSDYLGASGTLTIPAGQTSATISVPVSGDRLPETNETFVVNLGNPTNATIAAGQAVGTITDDEPRISVSDVTLKEGNGKKATPFTFTVTLSAAYDQPVTVSYHTTDGTATTGDGDYVAKSGTITFAPGETTKTITVVVNGDGKKEATEYFYLDLFGNSTNSLFTKNRGLGTILNDD